MKTKLFILAIASSFSLVLAMMFKSIDTEDDVLNLVLSGGTTIFFIVAVVTGIYFLKILNKT